MGKAGKLIVALVIVAVVAGGVLLLTRDKDKKESTNTQTNTNATSGLNSKDTAKAADVTITYDGTAFVLSANTIKAGGTVMVVNNSSQNLDFSSDPHPTHTNNSELNAGDIGPGTSATFTLTTKGKWGFHNHLNSSQKGSLTVE